MFFFYCVCDCFFAVFFMIMDAFLLNSCSKAAPAALGGCGGLGQLWQALAENQHCWKFEFEISGILKKIAQLAGQRKSAFLKIRN